MFELDFATGNDAFSDYPQQEAGRILREIAGKVELGATGGPVYDHNGNRIGAWSFEIPEPDEE